jgi:hypothetical protein
VKEEGVLYPVYEYPEAQTDSEHVVMHEFNNVIAKDVKEAVGHVVVGPPFNLYHHE